MRQLLILLTSLLLPAMAQSCPDLQAYYPGEDPDWPALERQLAPLMPQCLLSAEYFALLGAAQFNSNLIPEALESLERALLLDPDNGAAQIDYAQALYLQGQLFAALDMSEQLLARADLPEALRPVLRERHESWRGETRQRSLQADLLAGYDTNLNGAPDPNQITLTLSGEAVTLPLDPEFRPTRGPYTNMRLAGRFRQLAPSHDHNVLVAFRGRVSEDTDSDLLQLDTRYSHNQARRHHNWQFNAGMGHLMFGGRPLYSATEGGARYQKSGNNGGCRPHYEMAVQHQLFHNQSIMNGIESKAAAGLTCPANDRHLLGLEFGLLHNAALKANRPGGTRGGWQARMDWQAALPKGILAAQLNHTRMDDRRGFSEILADGAERYLHRSFMLLQYRQPIQRDMTLLINFYHQRQRSNIELFENRDTTLEIGVSFNL